MCAQNKVGSVAVFEKKMFEAKVDGNTFTMRGHDMTEEEILLS
jgi:hypothetical protein